MTQLTISKSLLKQLLQAVNPDALQSAEDYQGGCEAVFDLLTEEYPFLLDELDDEEE